MNRFIKVLLAGLLIALVVAPVAAQDDGENIIIESTFGSGPVNFNPVTSTSANEQDIMNLLYPGLVGVNPETGLIEPGVPGGVAESWDVSEDGTVYTFHLRDDFFWSDGTPLTAHDFGIVWDIINSGEVETNLVFLLDSISNMEVIDDYTLEVTFPTPDCEALWSVGIQPIQSTRYADGDFSVLNDEFYLEADAPEVGPYQLSSHIQDQQTALVGVEGDGYPDGDVAADGYITKVVGDQTVEVEQFLAGEIHILESVPVNRRADMRAAAEEGTVNVYEYIPGNAYDYMAFNTADPENPVAAYDEDGNLVEQDPHPIFGDVRVRQAISMAVDVEAIIEGAVFGEGTRMASSYAEGTWPYDPDVQPYAYDVEAAAALLEEAGWVDHDNDPATPRIAQGSETAEDGTEMRFTLYTNQGNTRREAIGTIVQDQLSDLGIAVDFQTIDFNVLLEILDSQSFDSIILGWQNGYPFRADQTQLWSTTSDIIAGDNFTSYINPELDALFEQARTIPGCDPAQRAEIYGQIQEILHRDAPYLFLFSQNGMYATRSELQGVNPFPANLYWNLNEWTVSSD